DKTGRFKFLPSISDGQLLFMQHLISKLDAVGMGVVVHNGSTLFSGDAGSQESNIRKWMLDSDIVEAVIQLPTDEFFNTGIYTYLWVLNKNKQPEHKDKVMLINASEKFKPLKKSKGSKRKEVDEASRLEIVDTLTKYQNNDYARVFDKEFFYFNKEAIMLTNVDEYGNSFEAKLKEGKKSEKLTPTRITNGESELTEFVITTFDASQYDSLADAFAQDIKPFIASLDYKEQPLIITTAMAQYWFDTEQETLIKEVNGKKECLGCGKIVVKSAYKKASKKQSECIEISVDLTADYQKDYEIIPFHKDEAQNLAAIEDFMAKYITKPFTYLENVVGVELNFNKIFYKPEKLREVVDILAEIDALDGELEALEAELAL
ncbi:MAG: N-6 DNA methylase, partial [Deltaproteobacteria bacterium]|nr:N-6 DNA methylase [Deltaproteobacteria bacterium]